MNKFLVGSILCLLSLSAHAMDTGSSPDQFERKVTSFRQQIQNKVAHHTRSGSHGPSEVAHLLTSLQSLKTLEQAETALKNKIGNKGAEAWLNKRKKTYKTEPGWEGAWLYTMVALLVKDPETFLKTIKQRLPKPQLRRHRSLLFDLYTDPGSNIKPWQSMPDPRQLNQLQKNPPKSASRSSE